MKYGIGGTVNLTPRHGDHSHLKIWRNHTSAPKSPSWRLKTTCVSKNEQVWPHLVGMILSNSFSRFYCIIRRYNSSHTSKSTWAQKLFRLVKEDFHFLSKNQDGLKWCIRLSWMSCCVIALRNSPEEGTNHSTLHPSHHPFQHIYPSSIQVWRGTLRISTQYNRHHWDDKNKLYDWRSEAPNSYGNHHETDVRSDKRKDVRKCL